MEGVLFLIIIPTLLFFFSKVSSIATNTLIPNQVLRHNQSLVSENQTFELGFFNPSTSNNQYYLGIWYKNIKIQTVVWVANRNNPLTDSSGVLKINNNGNLVLLSRNNSIIWSSSSNHSTTKNPIARLLDSGNFVLKYEGGNDDPESYLWQSFDYPSDTVLESMKFGFNLKTGLSQQLTSWKNQDDPSLGNFTFRIDPHGFPEFILRKGSIKQFRSGPWNGLQFSGEPEMMTKVMPNPMFEFNNKEMYFVFARSNNSVILRFMLTPSGLLQALRWNEQNMEWITMITVQKDLCDSYGLCGAYSNCSMSNSPVCNCLKGFTPKSQHDWDGGEWSGGCVRRTPLYCNSNGDGDGFKKYESVKIPDTSGSWVNKSMNLKECEVKCLNNCSCTAYANSDIRGEGSGCVMWFGELVDLRQFNFGGQDLYVRMASSELDINGDSRKRKKPMIVMVSVPIVMGILICCIIWKIKAKKRGTKKKIYYTNESQKDEMELPLFDFATIATATNNFSSDGKLGEGGFGSVYKGELSNGQEIAVKRLSTNSGQGFNEFKNEVILIAKLQHRNLVRLLGCCIEREEKMLIYEYMANKSLDFFIFDQARSTLLSWKKRFHIIKGIAQGLLYLHRDSRLRIIHRDLKASNILLDNEMNPKISDFGMARTFGGDQTEANTNRVVGTYGYMSPEYAIDGLFSIKSDVFSFGVLVLEIVCGKKNRGFFHPDHDLNLIGHAWKVWNKGKAWELIDSSMGDQLLESEVLRCIHVGLLCVQQRPEDRPTMSSVVLMLSNEGVILPKPKQPGFYNERSLTEGNSVSSEKMFSSTKVSITFLGGR